MHLLLGSQLEVTFSIGKPTEYSFTSLKSTAHGM